MKMSLVFLKLLNKLQLDLEINCRIFDVATNVYHCYTRDHDFDSYSLKIKLRKREIIILWKVIFEIPVGRLNNIKLAFMVWPFYFLPFM